MEKEITTVSYLLTLANTYKLEAEIVTFALKYMKEDPSLTIEEAMSMGYEEWIK